VGANIGLYGRDTGSTLEALLLHLGRMPDRPRIRLSSIEPLFVTPELLSAVKAIDGCRHFHIPIQSADSAVLAQMNRGYDAGYLKRMIDLISATFEDVAIGADLIVGFPAESEAEFVETFNFVKDNPLTHLHVFPYSPRPQTEAYDLGDPVPKTDKKDRLWRLKKLINEKNHDFRRNMIGKKFRVVIEHKDGACMGLTDNYIKADIDEPCAANSLVEIVVDRVTEDTTHGTPCVAERAAR
jgi:threonylcarbamoyladenosine tRNA methylthiotransferase MtaB